MLTYNTSLGLYCLSLYVCASKRYTKFSSVAAETSIATDIFIPLEPLKIKINKQKKKLKIRLKTIISRCIIMLKKFLAILLSSAVAVTVALPLGAKTTYDQRQEGDFNVKVDLDNFVILVARPVSSLDIFGTMAGLLAANDDRHTDIQAVAASASENADGATDSGGGNSNNESSSSMLVDQLDDKEEPRSVENVKQHPQLEEKKTLDHQDSGSKPKTEEKVAGKGLEEVVRNLRSIKEKELELRSKEKPIEGKAAGKHNFVGSVEEAHYYKLVGDGVENCGPGRSRDSKGICEGDDKFKE